MGLTLVFSRHAAAPFLLSRRPEGQMPRRKQARRVTMRDIRSILRLTFEQGLSVRAVSDRLKLSKTTVATYLLRAREAGLACWPLPADSEEDAVLARALFQRAGRPPRDGPVPLSCRPRCSFKPPFARKRRDFSSPMLSGGVVDCRSH